MKTNNLYQERQKSAFNFKFLKQRRFWQSFVSFIFFATLLLIALSGCSEKVVFKEVLVPQKCSVSVKNRPLYTQDILNDTRNLLIYTELLECDLKACRGESCDKKGVRDENH